MTFSVWRWGHYDYYRADGPSLGDRAKPPRRFDGEQSVPIEAALPELPAGAVKIGSGEVARGRVAVDGAEAAVGASFGASFGASDGASGASLSTILFGVVAVGLVLLARKLF